MKFRAAIFLFLSMAGMHTSAIAQPIPDQIDAILARAAVVANTWTIIVENETGSVRYYQRSPTTGRAPASNTKIFTTSGAFALLGTNHFFESRVYLQGPFTNGILTGNLNLVSEHDMTWNTSVFSGNARKGLDHIATQLKNLGLTQINGNVQCYGVCIYNYGSTDSVKDIANQDVYNGQTATAFIAALQAQGITVSGVAVGQVGFNSPGTLFYTHKSSDLTYGGKPLRLDVACIPLMKVSHNVMADQLLRHIGYKLSGSDSFTLGRNQVFNWLQNTVGISTNGMVMNDGSGLSSANRFSAQQIISLVRYMINSYPSWNTTLPIGCVDGTIGSRFCGTDGDGQVHAKTGSLSSSIALSGYIDNQYDNRRYFFSFIGNDSSGIDQTATRDAIDDCVVLFGARGVPTSPQLLAVTNNGNTLTATWSDEKFIRTGYRLYSSSDGVTFEAPINLGANVHSSTSALSPGTKRYFRVTVVGSGGESPPSRVYGAQAGAARSPILIVDGFDRWQFNTSDNPTAANHHFASIVGQSISGPSFDTIHHNRVANGAIVLTNYPAVVWFSGNESTEDESFSSTEQNLVASYLTAGGNLFVSGSEIAWDLDQTTGPTGADRDFYHNHLRALFLNDDANTYAFTAVTNGIFSANANSGFDNGTRGTYNVRYPDTLTPTNNGTAALLYSGGTGGIAAITYSGVNGGKLVNFGFPFETITNSAARDAYMSDILRFFSLLAPPHLLMPQTNAVQNNITLRWTASAGLKYRLQYKTNLEQTTWSNLLPEITATNTTASTTDSLGNTRRFYRVLLVN